MCSGPSLASTAMQVKVYEQHITSSATVLTLSCTTHKNQVTTWLYSISSLGCYTDLQFFVSIVVHVLVMPHDFTFVLEKLHE